MSTTVKLDCPQCGELGSKELIQEGNDGPYGGTEYFICPACDYETRWSDYVLPDLVRACKAAERCGFVYMVEENNYRVSIPDETYRDIVKAIAKAEAE